MASQRPADQWPEAGPSQWKSSIMRGQKGEDETGTGLTTSLRRRSSAGASWGVGRRYAVIVDAGSSGSRMQIYSWKEPRIDKSQREKVGESIKVLPTVEKGTWEGSGRDWQKKVEPGISSFGSHPEDLGDYLKPLFDHAASIIPPASLSDTPVYVLATAGMRFLPAAQSQAIIERTCNFISQQTPFSLGTNECSDHVQVITGEEEGLLGWIAINYLMDGFHYKSTSASEGQLEGTKGRSTFGFLDMGGASTQIAFEPSPKTQSDAEASQDLTAIKLRMLDGTDVTHNVFVTTFLGFGTNKARERYVTALQENSSSLPSVSDPVSDPCLPKGLRLVGEGGPEIAGTGSFDTCLKSLSPLLDKDAACSHPPCLFHGVHVPSIDFSVNHFIGVSEYWFSSNDVYKLGGVYDFVSLQKAAQDFCSRPWEDLEEELQKGNVFGPQVTRDRLEMQCFKSAWMTTVLHEGIGLPRIVDSGGKGDGKPHADAAQDKADEKNLFQSVNDVDGLAVSWTLGKAVLEASKEVAPLSTEITSIGLPLEATNKNGLPPNWPDSLSPALARPSKALLGDSKHPLGRISLMLIIVVSFILLSISCLMRGRNSKSFKRRSVLKQVTALPCLKKRPRGDYVLANMEEGSHDMDTLVEEGGGSGANNGEVVLSSDTASGEEADYPKGSRHKHRRSSGNGVLATLLVPIQQLALAMGMKSASTMTPSSANATLNSHRTGNKKRKETPRLALRRNNTSPALSRPASPRMPLMSSNAIASIGNVISRPASRASNNVLSPRLHASTPTPGQQSSITFGQAGATVAAIEASGGFFASQHYPVSASVSARSSRAASPSLGSSANGRSIRTNPASHFKRAWDE